MKGTCWSWESESAPFSHLPWRLGMVKMFSREACSFKTRALMRISRSGESTSAVFSHRPWPWPWSCSLSTTFIVCCGSNFVRRLHEARMYGGSFRCLSNAWILLSFFACRYGYGIHTSSAQCESVIETLSEGRRERAKLVLDSRVSFNTKEQVIMWATRARWAVTLVNCEAMILQS
jgi:hypothetical protein